MCEVYIEADIRNRSSRDSVPSGFEANADFIGSKRRGLQRT